MKKTNFLWLAGFGLGLTLVLRRRPRPAADHPFLAGPRPLVMAHRGGGGRWPENTLYAFERAAALGVDVLELDIHSTADGVLVVRHDPTVDSTTEGSGPIQGFTLAELKKLDAGYRWTADGGQTFPFRGQGITIPILEEVFAAFPDLRINIDIKQKSPAIMEPFAALLRRYDRAERVMVGSFDGPTLAAFRQASPKTATAAGVQETRLAYGLSLVGLNRLYRPAANAFQVPEWAGHTHLVTPRFIAAAHAHNLHVHVWTVDETADMQRLLAWGVDGIISDYPERLMAVAAR